MISNSLNLYNPCASTRTDLVLILILNLILNLILILILNLILNLVLILNLILYRNRIRSAVLLILCPSFSAKE